MRKVILSSILILFLSLSAFASDEIEVIDETLGDYTTWLRLIDAQNMSYVQLSTFFCSEIEHTSEDRLFELFIFPMALNFGSIFIRVSNDDNSSIPFDAEYVRLKSYIYDDFDETEYPKVFYFIPGEDKETASLPASKSDYEGFEAFLLKMDRPTMVAISNDEQLRFAVLLDFDPEILASYIAMAYAKNVEYGVNLDKIY